MNAGVFTLGRTALREVSQIISRRHREAGASSADAIERLLMAAFHDLALGKAIGHKRSDLTQKQVLFYMAAPYAIVFRKSAHAISVVRVIHASRDLEKLLQ